jgi:DNA-binding MurR/RpiR family transcriptional regulator
MAAVELTSAVLSQRILEVYDSLTKAERRLADVLLANPDTLALESATAISNLAEVSKATTARFFQQLNYVNYRSAQKAARTAGTQRDGLNGNRLLSSPAAVPLGQHLDIDVQNLVRTIEQLRSDELNSAITHLARADKLWVVGFGDNYPLAHFVRSMLIRIKADVRMIPIGGFSIPEEFASIQRSDAMIALGIGRKTRSLRSIMRSAVTSGAYVLYVTDQASRASAELAAATLVCRTTGLGVFDSAVAPMSVLTYLCSALALRIGASAIERIQSIEDIHDEWGDLLPKDI